MPELPEVEHAARLARRVAQGHRIARIRVLHRSQRRTLPPARQRALAGRRVRALERRGKYQLFHLDDGSVLEVHFRMTGDWERTTVQARYAPPIRAVLEFDSQGALALHDSRALSTITWFPSPAHSGAAHLGPDVIDPRFNARWLTAQLATRRGSIKAVLLDQRVAAGIGNIYAVEALWRARISPRRRAATLDAADVRSLVASLKAVLRRALASPGRYFGDEDDTASRYAVYGRAGEPCRRCGARIRRVVLAGRGTEFCPSCQR